MSEKCITIYYRSFSAPAITKESREAFLLRAFSCEFPNPASPVFSHDEKGAPVLVDCPGIHITLSHKKNVICAAFSDGPIGIDLEALVPFNEKISGRFFAPGEQAFLRETMDPLRGFYEIWTKKEAYVKFLGTGFRGISPSDFDVFDLEAQKKCCFCTFAHSQHLITLCTPFHPEDTKVPVLRQLS